MDTSASSHPPQELPPIQPAVELYPAREISQQLVDVQQYEPYSIAASIHSMFEEAEQQGFDETNYWRAPMRKKNIPMTPMRFGCT